ncbi:RNA polymerase sigma factor [Mycobacteroides abscessus subsp. bolletii 1S-154-0310]|nr:RNA polymerase sigma factor [Mycobacteroides abscessus 6G-0728-S]EIU61714.1 RNA polymerase sigma factor [Mycobacteroides abscessus subsp. bolletii 1S-151-0930]EIU69438.1 RNA polymerase sigma factor [Mycobacteroides abscessus subsp. bolletii 1S-152-0914]EIU76669.1 RNA polymerase sigma factor [Mycobacteroides abscessus subsp. bolletii 1S-153-0915]EIU82377.1 RNA polymerase sigma factor [Mycobacteroides abscessus subsp. bolletii 1S-154-0310]EIV77441.1 RNA polymerase sigma factor [Mycobacteroide
MADGQARPDRVSVDGSSGRDDARASGSSQPDTLRASGSSQPDTLRASGSSSLMRAFYDEYAGPLHRYVMHLTHDSALAEDIVQEVLLRAWRHPTLVNQTEGSARAWLFTVAHNLVRDNARSSRFRSEIATAETPEFASPDQVDATLDAWLVAEALRTLSTDHRAVILRAYYRGSSVADISAELGVPEGTVKSRLHYGVRALRLSLQEMGVTR